MTTVVDDARNRNKPFGSDTTGPDITPRTTSKHTVGGQIISEEFMKSSYEVDPNGKTSNVPGAKLDAGKSPVMQGAFQYFPQAIRAVADLSAKGAAKYSWKGWEHVPDGINRYGDAMARHILDESKGLYDNQPGGSGELHATAVAWNALARLELILRQLEAEDNPAK